MSFHNFFGGKKNNASNLPSEASIKFGDQGEVIVTGGPPPDAKVDPAG